MNIIKNNIFLLPLVATALLVAFVTHKSNTWLLGWDNLVPEFYSGLNIERSIFAFWQEYQGVGLLGGMSHAADLVRQLVSVPYVFLFEAESFRYVSTLGMLVLGVVGAGLLARKIFEKYSQIPALITGIGYLFNLATVQNFYVPFEPFVFFYGFLPWLLVAVIGYLEKPTRSNLFKFALVSVLATPAFYIQTLFVVYMILLFIFMLDYLFQSKSHIHKKAKMISLMSVIAVIALTNSFWLIPSSYFALTSVNSISELKGVYFPTPETKLLNEGAAKPQNISLLKGFWFDFQDYSEGEYSFLMPEWVAHFDRQEVQYAGYILALASFSGIASLIFRRFKYRYSIIFIYLFVIAVLLFNPFEQIPVLKQAFRSVFTKWSVVAGLFYSLGLGSIFTTNSKKIRLRLAPLLISLVMLLSFVMLPVFKGDLVSKNMKVDFPQEYIQLFDYFKEEPKSKRIAFFPVHSFWGWNFNDWGYRGSGFLWYGIEQPILDRAFDVWSPYNESFYLEMSNAVYQEDVQLLDNVIDKYDVGYILIDRSVHVPGRKEHFLRFNLAKKMLEELGAEKTWEEGSLSVYKVDSPDSFIYASDYTEALTTENFERIDPVFSSYGNYIERLDTTASYLFTDIFSDRNLEIFKNKTAETNLLSINRSVDSGKLFLPGMRPGSEIEFQAEVVFIGKDIIIDVLDPYNIDLNNKNYSQHELLEQFFIQTPNVHKKLVLQIGDTNIELAQGMRKQIIFKSRLDSDIQIKIYNADSPINVLPNDILNTNVNTCWQRDGVVDSFVDSDYDKSVLNISVKDAVGCISHKLSSLANIEHVLKVSLPHKSETGARPHFCVQLEGSFLCEHEDVFYNSHSSLGWDREDRMINLAAGQTYWLIVSAKPPEEVGSTWEISYREPKALAYPKILEVNFDKSFWNRVTQDQIIDIPEDDTLLSLSFSSAETHVEFGNNYRDCDIFERGEIKVDGTSYVAIDKGAVCDSEVLSGVSTRNEYLINIRGKNLSGRGFKFYLTNTSSERVDLETVELGDEFNSFYSTIAWPKLDQGDYVLNLVIHSFGGEKAEGEIDGVSFYPFPVTWISSIRLNEPKQHLEKAQIYNKIKIGTVFYKADVKATQDDLIILSQGYDSGWVAFSNGKILEHTKVNSWANGWILEGDGQVYIFYLPYLLQLLGFLSLIITPIGILLLTRK